MSRRPIEDLLQECLAAYDAGVTPEDCLSAFPDRRAELEPMLRQALCLRMAFTSMPSEALVNRTRAKLMFAAGREVSQAMSAEPRAEFVQTAKQRFMFAAGREVVQAMASEPDPDFKLDARRKLILAGGANAQETLRDVPPPRLPFWVNARRHLLEAAVNPPKPAPRTVAPALRFGMSMAGVAAALVIAMGAYFYSQSAPTSVGAEFAMIEQQTQQLQLAQQNGAPVSSALLADLTKRTNELAARLNEEPSNASVETRLGPLIERQRDIVAMAATVNSIKPPGEEQQLQQAQVQLQQAEDKVRVLAARANAPAASNNSAPQSAAAAEPPAPTTTSTPTKAPVIPVVPAAPQGPVAAGQVRVRTLPADTTLGIAWVEVRTATIRFVAPASWTIVGLTLDANGIAGVGPGNAIGFTGPEVTVIVNLANADFNGQVGSNPLTHFQVIDLQALVTLAGPQAPILRHMVESVEGSVSTAQPQVVPPTATATPVKTPTPVPPVATATPVPSTAVPPTPPPASSKN